MTRQVKDSIDRIISGKGLLRIPAWWMRSLLRKMVDAIDRVRSAVDKVQGNVDKVRNSVDKVQSDVNSMEAKWPIVRYNKDRQWLVISDGNDEIAVTGVDIIPTILIECSVRAGVDILKINNKNYNVDNGKILIPVKPKPTNTEKMFASEDLTSIDLSELDTSEVESMRWMFSHCKRISSLDVSNFDTSRVKDMTSMFNGCALIRVLDLSMFDLSSVKDMSMMFIDCTINDLKMVGFGKNPDATDPKTFIGSHISSSSLRYILKDHSFDRAAAGYAPCKLYIQHNYYLSTEDKAAVSAKGFTVSSGN